MQLVNIKTLFQILFFRYIKKENIIIIKHPSTSNRWGDYHLAESLAKGLRVNGFVVFLHNSFQFYNIETIFVDVVIKLQGRKDYKPNKFNKNIIWIISHPEDLKESNLKKYDLICVASKSLQTELQKKYNTYFMPQFTDPDIFRPSLSVNNQNDVLFIGNSRNVYRDSVRYCIEGGIDFSLYGSNWEKYVGKKYIKGEFIENDELNDYYSNAKIVLNDHWAEMKQDGFLSNRIYDVTASGGFLMSDYMPDIEEYYKGSIATYKTKEEFIEKIKYYLEHKKEREILAEKARDVTLKMFTVRAQVDKLSELIKEMLGKNKLD